MNDYGISEYAPEFAKNFPENAQDLVKYLEDEIGVPTQCSLNDITVEDLLESNLLKKGAAKKLVKAWKQDKPADRNFASNFRQPVDQSSHTLTIGDNAQIGGSRDIYNGSVNNSSHTIVRGNNAQIGGTRNIGSGNVANNNIEHLNVRGGAHFGIGDFNKNDWH